MTRRNFLALTSLLALPLLIAGCGGGGGGDDTVGRVTNTGGTGSIAEAVFSPSRGAVFVGASRSISLIWSNPPPEFRASLNRYREARGDEERSIGRQKVTLTRVVQNNLISPPHNQWELQRRDNFDLDTQGVYYVELGQAGQETVRSCFIVSADRSTTPTSPATRAETASNTGGSGFLNGVQIFPRPGSTFIARNQRFQLRWEDGAQPPPNFEVQLRRYKEPRGDAGKEDAEQRIDLDREGGTFVWNVSREDDFDLDRGGVYYLEINSGGEQIRAAYIVENN